MSEKIVKCIDVTIKTGKSGKPFARIAFDDNSAYNVPQSQIGKYVKGCDYKILTEFKGEWENIVRGEEVGAGGEPGGGPAPGPTPSASGEKLERLIALAEARNTILVDILKTLQGQYRPGVRTGNTGETPNELGL